LYTVQALQEEFDIAVEFVNVSREGTMDYAQFSALFSNDIKTLVSLMHVNNETGVINDIEKIGTICHQNKALFHCDTVQSIGKTELNLQELAIDFLVASAHKFHGPKGVGFAYVRKNLVLQPMILGGEQEKGWRAGTESVHQIAGMAKALELSFEYLNEERKYITDLKQYCFQKLQQVFPEFSVNGDDTSYNILNVLLPFSPEKTVMILSVSRGSACQSGSAKPSHVLAEMLNEEELKKPSLRISFSHYNTKEEIDCLISALNEI
jgi:cysteine desulfurase